jgi:hypothetical protein
VLKNREFCVEKYLAAPQLRSSMNVFVLFAFNVWPTWLRSAPNVVAHCHFHYKVQYMLLRTFPRANGHALVKQLAAFVGGNVLKAII